MNQAMQHEYRRRLLKALDLGIIDRGSMAHVEVRHDNWCAAYDGRACNCDPEIEIQAKGGSLFVTADGLLEKRGMN